MIFLILGLNRADELGLGLKKSGLGRVQHHRPVDYSDWTGGFSSGFLRKIVPAALLLSSGSDMF